MTSKVPVRVVFDGSNNATGLAEYQSGEFVPLTHGGLGASLTIGSAGQVLKVNSGATAIEFGSIESLLNIDNLTDGTGITIADADNFAISDGGTEKRVEASQIASYVEGGISGDITISSGTASIASGVIVNADISGSAAIADSKLDTISTANKVSLAAIDIDGGTDIGAALTTSDLIVVDDGAGGTNRKAALSRLVTLMESEIDTIDSNLTVSGNLTVTGTTTTVSSTNTVVSDKLFELGNGVTGTPSGDIGLVFERGDENNAFVGFDESEDKFIIGTGTFTGASTGNLTITTGTLVANLEATTATLGGSDVISTDNTKTLTNKTIDTANNTITVVEADISDLGSYITASSTDTLTNKTFDANGTGNSISNIEVADFATGVLDTDLSSVSASDDTIPSAKATKAYVDAQVTAQDLDFQADTGGALNIDLDSESLTFTGGTGIDTTGSGNEVTFAIDSTVTTLTGTQTLTNKTLTTPVISTISNTGTITLPTDTDTLVGRATTDTLTNKTLTSPQINTQIDLLARAEIRFQDTSGGQYVALEAPDTVSSSVTFVLPAADGEVGQSLTTDGSGNLSFADAAKVGFTVSTITSIPGSGGDFDLTKTNNEGSSETPFESSTDAFGVSEAVVFDAMEPIGNGGTTTDLGAFS